MSEKFTRRTFLKLSGLGAAAAAVLTGCGPMARYVVRQPYYDMPEYAQLGESTYFATTCRECPAGCGIIMRTFEGRAIKAEGNPNQPVNAGKLCSRGLVGVQGLYNPDRILQPMRRMQRNDAGMSPASWDDGLAMVKQALQSGDRVAFLLGLAPDHLYDLAVELAKAIGAPAPVRYGALGMFEARATLAEAALQVFGQKVFPTFDVGGADVLVSFGAGFLETWLSPVAYTRAYSRFRRIQSGLKARGYMIAVEARRGLTAGNADEWLACVPGSEGLLAQALGSLLAARGAFNGAPAAVDVDAACQAAGVTREKLEHVAEVVAAAKKPLFLPGGAALAHRDGLKAAVAILALNVGTGGVGREGGVWLAASGPDSGPINDVAALVERMRSGQVETLFVHGINPVFELPASLGFVDALAAVKNVVSFSSFPDETALSSDWVLPDHSPLESWGYQRSLAGSDRPIYAALQPVVVPLHNTRATADVLLSAGLLPYADEVAFIQSRLLPLLSDPQGAFQAENLPAFWAKFLQFGGWWTRDAQPVVPQAAAPAAGEPLPAPQPAGEGRYHLVVYPTQLGDGSGANRPWLQETPNPDTTVMWNSWVEINPQTAEELGLANDDVVLIQSPAGQIEAAVYKYPAIRPDTVAIPFGQGHTALGRYAAGRGSNPAELLEVSLNEAGDLALGDTTVTLEKTGRRRPLSRYESKVGVYGEH